MSEPNAAEIDPLETARRVGHLTVFAGGLATGTDTCEGDNLSTDCELSDLKKLLRALAQTVYAGKEAELFDDILDIVADPPNDEKDPIEALWSFFLSFEEVARFG